MSESVSPSAEALAAEIAEASQASSQTPVTTTATAVDFHGKGGEYFAIWIVNLLLSVVTLGIYSAWAKVRSKQYFYGNSELLGSSFEYLATGGQILKGRLIGLVFFALYLATGFISPFLELAGILVVFLLSPFLVNAGLRFNARYSAWRGVRFDFEGSYGQAFKVFVLFPILCLFSLGLLIPWTVQKTAKYIVEGHSYGDEKFTFDASVGLYYKKILGVLLLSIAAVFGAFVVAVVIDQPLLAALGIWVGYAVMLMFKPVLFNLYWSHVAIKDNRFEGHMSIGRYVWIFTTNTLAMVLTLGLLYPWAAVRMARFTAQSMTFNDAGTVDSIVATQKQSSNAIGEEAAELFDADVGFGV